MPSRSPKMKYSDFRMIVEQARGRKIQVRHEFVPSIVAWFLTIRNQYVKTLKALEEAWARDASPESTAARHYYETAIKAMDHAIHLTDQRMPMNEWEDACDWVRNAFCILPGDKPHIVTDPANVVPEPEVPKRARNHSRKR